jgi:PAS domain S-box-containing protein
MLLENIWFSGSLLLLLIIGGIVIIYYQQRLIQRYRGLIGDSKKLRQRYTEFVDLLPQTVIELDTEGVIKFLNDAGYEFLGINRYDIKKGINIRQFIIDEQKDRFHQDFMYILEGGLNKGQEYSLKSKKGKFNSINIYLSPIVNNEHIEGLRGIIIDISKNKSLERKAFRAVIDTEERERKRYSEDLHDGLGPLLSTIKLYINQLNQDIGDDKQKSETLSFTNDLIDEAISTTRTIANNILPSSIEDNGLWAAVVSFCKHIEKTGAVKFELVNNTKLKFMKKAQNNIYRILIELINNTIKHAHAKNIRISFELLNDDLKIVYSDDGVGISDDRSNGLGISNIENRSNSLNGKYRFFNEGGMRFELLLPIVELSENTRKIEYV